MAIVVREFSFFSVEPVETLNGGIEGLGIDVVVGNRIEMGVGDLDIASALFGKDGVSLNDEGIAKFVASEVPQTGCGVVEQIAVSVVIDGIGDTQIVVHQCRYKVQMGGTVLVDD